MTGATPAALQQRWLDFTRHQLPQRARAEQWFLRDDHCFQRVVLDAVCGGRWYDHIEGRPAYRHLDDDRLRAAVALAERLAGDEDAHDLLRDLDADSLRYRGKRPRGGTRAPAVPRDYTDGS